MKVLKFLGIQPNPRYISVKSPDTFKIQIKTPRCPRVKAFLSPHHPIHLSLPRYRPLPPSGASFTLLLYNLGTEKVLSLFYHVLTQQKILIHTLNLKGFDALY